MNIENILLSFPFLLCGIIGFVAGIREIILKKRSGSNKELIRIPAKVIEIRSTRDSVHTTAAPLIEYTYKGTTYNKFAVIQGSVSKYKVGDEVVVLYRNGL